MSAAGWRVNERAQVLKRYGREALLKFGYTDAELDEAQAVIDGGSGSA